jgi:hypothetical protein
MKVASSFHPPVLLAFGTTILSLVLVSAVPYRSYTRSRQSDGWIRQRMMSFIIWMTYLPQPRVPNPKGAALSSRASPSISRLTASV